MPNKPLPPTGEIILYPTPDSRTRVECCFAGETVWLTQALMSDLFQKDVRTINEHLQNLFDEGELNLEATIRKFRIVRMEGQREVARLIEHYNLDAIISDGVPLHIATKADGLILRPAVLGENHVSSRAVPGGRRPIIDLENNSLLAGLAAFAAFAALLAEAMLLLIRSQRPIDRKRPAILAITHK